MNYISTLGKKPLTNIQIVDLQHMAENEKGRLLVIPMRVEGYPILVFARQIRKISKLELSNIGTLVLIADFNKLIQQTGIDRMVTDQLNIAIQYNSSFIYSNCDEQEVPMVIEDTEKINSQKRAGDGYFYSQWTDSRTELTYILFALEKNLFRSYMTMRKMLLIAMLLMIPVIILMSHFFSRSMIKPIRQLITRMERARGGDFTNDINRDFSNKFLEISELDKHFEIMLSKIDSLILEERRKEVIVRDAQYRAIQAQINPHFLYNTLDSIYWLAKSNKNTEVAQMVSALGYLLRTSISVGMEPVSIDHEITTLYEYISIQSIRYRERLSVMINNKVIDGERWSIPNLTLQPLVENSIEYGLERNDGTCHIEVLLQELEEKLQIIVHDDGPGMPDEKAKALEEGKIEPTGKGIGLKNIRERLMLMYDGNCDFRIQSSIGIGTSVIIQIPPRSNSQVVLPEHD